MAISHRPAFTQAHPELRHAHRDAQCALFGAARNADLPTDESGRDAMLDGINNALNRCGARRLISRTQLNIEEMQAVTIAIENGAFGTNWEWNHGWFLFISVRTMRLSTVRAEPRDGARAREIVARHQSVHAMRATAR